MIQYYNFYQRCLNKIQSIIYQRTAIYQLKKANAEFADDIVFIGSNTLSIQGKLSIGKAFICRTAPCCNSRIEVYSNGELIIGDYSGTNNITLLCSEKIHIGNHVNIGNGSYIYDSNFHSLDWQKRKNRIEDIKDAKSDGSVVPAGFGEGNVEFILNSLKENCMKVQLMNLKKIKKIE